MVLPSDAPAMPQPAARMPPAMPLDSASSMVGPGVIASAIEAKVKSSRVLAFMASCAGMGARRASACQGRFDDGALAVRRGYGVRCSSPAAGAATGACLLPRNVSLVALACVVGLRLRPGLPAASARRGHFERDAVDRADRNAEFAARAMRPRSRCACACGCRRSRRSGRHRGTACSRCTRPRRSPPCARGPSTPNCGSSGPDRPARESRPAAARLRRRRAGIG